MNKGEKMIWVKFLIYKKIEETIRIYNNNNDILYLFVTKINIFNT